MVAGSKGGAEVQAWSPGPHAPSCLSGSEKRQYIWEWATVKGGFWLALPWAGEEGPRRSLGQVVAIAVGVARSSPALQRSKSN